MKLTNVHSHQLTVCQFIGKNYLAKGIFFTQLLIRFKVISIKFKKFKFSPIGQQSLKFSIKGKNKIVILLINPITLKIYIIFSF